MKTLSQCLRALYEAIECTQLEEFDGDKKSEWMVFVQECINAAVTIEENFGLPDLAQKNEALVAELESIKHGRESDRVNNAAQIDILKKELDSLLKEKKERSKSEAYPELPREQFWILEALPIESAGCLKVSEIAEKADWPIDEVDVHLKHLAALVPNLVHHTYDQPKNWKWFCTTAGTKYLMKVRADPEQMAHYARIPRLDSDAERVLKIVEKFASCNAVGIEMAYRGRSRAGGASDDIIQRLIVLRGKELVGATFGTKGVTDRDAWQWFITDTGRDYFSQHRGPRTDQQ